MAVEASPANMPTPRPSPRPEPEESPGLLSCFGGFTPRAPASLYSPGRPHWSHTAVDADLMHLEHAPQLAAKIMKKRQQERERSNNRLTPRMQRIGLDIAALNTQVAEKQAVAAAQKNDDELRMQMTKFSCNIFGQADALLQASQRDKHKECVKYSLEHHHKDTRSERHLSDPHQLKKDKPPRIEGLTPPSISSMQKFEGEEGSVSGRKKEQRQVQVQWLMAQMAEKKLREDLEKETDREHDETLLQANELRHACEAASWQERQADVLETVRVNEEMASARTARKQAATEREHSVTKDHMANESEYNLMRERHDYSVGSNGRKRDYKRCSIEEERRGWDTNRALVEAKLARQRSQGDVDAEYNQLGMVVDLIGAASDDAFSKQERGRRQNIDASNRLLAQEHKERAAREKNELLAFASPRPIREGY